MPMAFDNLEVAVLGYDAQAKRMRSFVFVGTDNFKPVETTADPYNRIFALGHYGAQDLCILEKLTQRMKLADSKKLPWIASCLRDAAREVHEKYPVEVGEPSFYAAIDPRGPVELPAEFPPAPSHIPELATVHHITTNKEQAFASTWRFFIGSITTPRAGAPDSIGNNDGGTGAQSGQLNVLNMAIISQLTAGNGSITNPLNAVDGDLTTAATLSVTGNSGTNQAQMILGGGPALTRRYSSFTAKVRFEVTQNNLNNIGGAYTSILIQVYGAGGAIFGGINLETDAPGAGVVAIQTKSATPPFGVNPGQVQVNILLLSNNNTNSGTATLKVYEAWIEAIE